MMRGNSIFITAILTIFLLLVSACTVEPVDSLAKEQGDSSDDMSMKEEMQPSQTLDLNATHPISDTMGCSEDGPCEPTTQTLFGTISADLVRENNELGYFVRPSDSQSYPGIVLMHEWWGLNDNVKSMADYLASEGYMVLAVDLYNGEVAENATKARELVTQYNSTQGVQKMQAAAEFLRTSGSQKIGSMGWCFGGAQSLQLALSGEKLDATIIYYGSLTDSNLERITWPVLGIFGEEDQSIPPASVQLFEQALNAQGIQNDITIYSGVGHAFANPSNANFAPEQTEDAWKKTIAFLDMNLQ